MWIDKNTHIGEVQVLSWLSLQYQINFAAAFSSPQEVFDAFGLQLWTFKIIRYCTTIA